MTTKATQTVVDLPSFGFKNKIINGRMEVAQRGTSFFSISNGDYTLDRWPIFFSGLVDLEVTQHTDVPDDQGLINSLRIHTTVGDPINNTGDGTWLSYRMEGYDIIDIYGGPITLSFWVKSTTPGIYCVAFRSGSNDRTYIAEYTIDQASTWEKKEITIDFIPGGGTWKFDNDEGLQLWWALHHYEADGIADSWQSAAMVATANQVNHTATTGGDFWITGVELVKGKSCLPIPEARPWPIELLLCRRYYWQGKIPSSYGYRYGAAANAMMDTGAVDFSPPMRDQPSITELSAPTYNNCTFDSFYAASGGGDGFSLRVNVTATGRFRAYGGEYAAFAELS